MKVRALIFDFNGVISQDEPLHYEIVAELLADYGLTLDRERYFLDLAGLPDEDLFAAVLGPGHPDTGGLIEERITRYRRRAEDGSTVPGPVRDAVRLAASLVPIALVSSSFRSEIEAVLDAAGLTPLFATIVSGEDVKRPKPAPDGYVCALKQLDRGLRPAEVVVLEDTEHGVVAAKAAGMRCVAVAGTLPSERLVAADEVVAALDGGVVDRLLNGLDEDFSRTKMEELKR